MLGTTRVLFLDTVNLWTKLTEKDRCFSVMDFWGRWIFFLTTTRVDSSFPAVPPERTQVEYSWLPQPHAFARISVIFGPTEIRNLCSR